MEEFIEIVQHQVLLYSDSIFDAETFKQLDPLLHDIRREFINDPRFSVLFRSLKRMGGPNDEAIKTVTAKEQDEIINILERKLYGSDYKVQADEPYVCYAAKPNSLLIRADGNIGKCTVALDDPRNNISFLRPDGTIKINQKRLSPWMRGLKNLDLNSLHCPLVELPEEIS